MPEYEFEIQNIITVRVPGKDSEGARQDVISRLPEFGEQMITSACVVSDGKEVLK